MINIQVNSRLPKSLSMPLDLTTSLANNKTTRIVKMTYKTKEIKSRGTLMHSTNHSSHESAEYIQRSGSQSETAPFSSTITPQCGSIAAGLAEFPSDLVEQTRARIRSESRIQREAIERNIEALDAAQQASRQEAARRNGRIGGRVYNLRRVQKNRRARLLEEEHEGIASASEATYKTKEIKSRGTLTHSTNHS